MRFSQDSLPSQTKRLNWEGMGKSYYHRSCQACQVVLDREANNSVEASCDASSKEKVERKRDSVRVSASALVKRTNRRKRVRSSACLPGLLPSLTLAAASPRTVTLSLGIHAQALSHTPPHTRTQTQETEKDAPGGRAAADHAYKALWRLKTPA